MTTVFNIVGGPGVGKSTMAAYLFYLLKQKQANAELVREVAKEWAWEQKPITPYEQYYIAAEHIRMEGSLFGKVDYIVTDYPVLLSIYYAKKHAPHAIARGVRDMVTSYYEAAESEGHRFVNVYLERIHPYDPKGRFQTKPEAEQMDKEMLALLNQYTGSRTEPAYRIFNPTEEQMKSLVWGIR